MFGLFEDDCQHQFKEVRGGFTVDRENDVSLKIIRCAKCGETASLDHHDELEWSYK